MKITILQTDITWAAPAENRRRAEAAIREMPGADLYVLPEMFSTGFCTDPAGIAERDGETLAWMKQQAALTGAAVAGSVAVEEEGKYYNRLYFVKPDGTEEHYDKRHLFTYGGEHEHYTRGDRRVVVEWQGVRILLQVCYDLRFPVWSRNDRHAPYDLILYVANWPAPRIAVWNTLLTARAIENQCYVAGVNRVGTDPTCHYPGCSALIDPYGRPLTTCHTDGQPGAVTATIDLARLTAFRRKFPVLEDGDDADSMRH